jgi:hypothetical protein
VQSADCENHVLQESEEKATKDSNTKKKELLAMENFTGRGATTIITLKRLQVEILEHLGVTNKLGSIAIGLEYLFQVTMGSCTQEDHLVDILKRGRQQVANVSLCMLLKREHS